MIPEDGEMTGQPFWEKHVKDRLAEQEAEKKLKFGFECFLGQSYIKDTIDEEHIKDTPDRVVKMYKEFFVGCKEDPRSVLQRKFSEQQYDEMIWVNDIKFVSFCAHHTLPFFGRVHFAYLPNKYIVGLSKIPRLVEILSKRPQVQEQLTQQIVNIFQEEVEPKGCAATVEAIHFCMAIRGVKKEDSYTKTNALRGVFKTNDATRQEFIAGTNHKNGGGVWR